MLAQTWAKFNANEKLATCGAGLVILAFLLGIVFYRGFIGYGTGVLALLGAIALPVIYYLKYTNSTINWPAPIPLIAFAIGAVVGILALLALINLLQWFGLLSFNVTWLIAPIINIVGCALMARGTYKEWSASRALA